MEDGKQTAEAFRKGKKEFTIEEIPTIEKVFN